MPRLALWVWQYFYLSGCENCQNSTLSAAKMNLKIIFQKNKAKNFIRKTYSDLPESVIEYFLENYGYTIPISLLAKLDVITKEFKPQLVFEFGSGVSTILIASNLKNSRGRIFTFDESLKWIENTYRKCPDIDNVLFIFAPSSEKINYDIFTKNIDISKKIDLLIIDGPSGDRFTEQAIQLYDKLISSDTICVIDDTDRETNDIEAQKLAKAHNLRKMDYRDPLYTRHKYSILYPQSMKENF